MNWHNLNIFMDIKYIMFKKWDFFILLALLLVIAALLPVSANDLNVTDGGLEAQNSEIITVDDSSDILGQNGEASIGDTVYFDASAASDGNGSKENPFKYLTPERIASGTAYFAEGTYYLNETCTFSNSKLVGESVSETIIMSLAGNSYDFIIPYNSSLEMESLYLEDFNILNQGTLKANNMFFEGNDVFDVKNPPEIQNGSGYFDSSFGGVIVCDTPYDIMNTLVLKGCQFQYVFDAFNGGAIAAINSNITIIDSLYSKEDLYQSCR